LERIPRELLIEVEQKYLDEASKEKEKCYNTNWFASGGPCLTGTRNASWKEVDPEVKENLFQEYKSFGNIKTKEKATLYGYGGCAVFNRLVKEFKHRLGLPLDSLNMDRWRKILTDEVKKDLLETWKSYGWTISIKKAREKYGVGYKTFRRTINEYKESVLIGA
jgi:hypothetical protein